MAAASLLLAACEKPGDTPVTPNPAGTTAAPAPVPSGLDSFYSQKLNWQDCSQAECADLTVPLDYANPGNGKTVTIKVLRVKAKQQKNRLGSLVVNPGGPGGSGVDYARAADFVVGGPVRNVYDVVGFDPRGVGKSDPVDCLDDKDLDTFLGTDPTPDDAAEQQNLEAQAKKMAQGCEAKSGELLPHIGTADAAKDMDVLRAALGDNKLNYLGKSYGTFLGATYADLFPKNVGRMVLDGVVAPDLTSAQLSEGQARGFEEATRAYLADCVAGGNCPAGNSVDEGITWLQNFLKQLDAKPLPSGDPAAPQLTEAWGSLGIAVAMYDQGSWGILTDALTAAKQGDGRALMNLANQYADRDPGGAYRGNIMEVIYGVNCLDRPDSPNLGDYEKAAKEFSVKAPTWGPFLAWGSLTCGQWPIKSTNPPHKISAQGSDLIVVVGTTRDPATIYEWSTRLRQQLSNAALITFDGDGHTAYTRSNACVDTAIDEYYVNGTAPKDGLTC